MNRFDWLICWKSPRKGGRPDTFANNIYYSKPDSSGSQATLSHECLLRLNVGVIKRKCRVKWLNKRKHIFDHHQHCISYMRLNDASFCVSFVWFKCGKIMNLLIGFPTTVSITSRLYKKKTLFPIWRRIFASLNVIICILFDWTFRSIFTII